MVEELRMRIDEVRDRIDELLGDEENLELILEKGKELDGLIEQYVEVSNSGQATQEKRS